MVDRITPAVVSIYFLTRPTSPSPYRRAFPHDTTLEMMAAEAGTRLDPALFDVFRGLDLGAPEVLAAA